MQVYRNTEFLPLFENAVVTIGTFDGVHTGHQQVLAQMKRRAAEVKGKTVIITFDPHPRTVIQSSSPIRMINTLDEKIELLSTKGIDCLVIVPFTESFARLSGEDYIREFLVRHFKPHTLIIGYDHHFGKDRSGNFALLKEQSVLHGYQLQEISAHLLDSISVSSTRIRKAIESGDLETANHLLGYTFFFSGVVVEGNKLGRTLGFPTANLAKADERKLIPGDGVYAVDAVIMGEPERRHMAMMNIGYRPTVGGKKHLVEVNLLDFDRDIYGKTLRVFVKKFLRPEQKFEGLEELKAQLFRDSEAAREVRP